VWIVLGALLFALLCVGAGVGVVLRAARPLRSRATMLQISIRALRLRFDKAGEELARIRQAAAEIEQLGACRR